MAISELVVYTHCCLCIAAIALLFIKKSAFSSMLLPKNFGERNIFGNVRKINSHNNNNKFTTKFMNFCSELANEPLTLKYISKFTF